MIAEFATAIISSAAVSAALVAFMLWMTKAWVSERLKNAIKAEYDTKLESHKAQLKSEYDATLESHKAQLKARSDIEIEKLKSTLSITASQRNTSFSHLQTRRVDVIAVAYANLRRLHDSVGAYLNPFEAEGGPSRAIDGMM